MQRPEEKPTDLLTSAEAALIIGRNSGKSIKPDYVRILASNKKLSQVTIDGRTKLYKRSEVESIRVSAKRGRKPAGK